MYKFSLFNGSQIWPHSNIFASFGIEVFRSNTLYVQYCTTLDQEIFVLKIFSALKFHGAKFRKADRLRKNFNRCEITMETFERELCVRGYHVYQRIWTAAVGEVLHCEREPTNSRDRYAVAVKIFVR